MLDSGQDQSKREDHQRSAKRSRRYEPKCFHKSILGWDSGCSKIESGDDHECGGEDARDHEHPVDQRDHVWAIQYDADELCKSPEREERRGYEAEAC